MSQAIDYRCVEIPGNKRPEDFSYTERRAAILQRIQDEGHPWSINKSALGRKYGVSHTTIGNDLEALGDHVAETVGDDHELVTSSVIKRAIRGLIEEERWSEAARIALKYEEWLMDIGAVDRTPEKQEVDATIQRSQLETDDYRVIPDDGAPSID